MGEYATFNGKEIKIGTCENLYYLRASQRQLVEYEPGFVDAFRYRFPFPDEDGIEPGTFADYDRGVEIPGYTIPDDVAGDPQGFPDICRHGHGQGIVIQQRILDGVTMTVIACETCRDAWRLPTLADAADVIAAFLAEAERMEYRTDSETQTTTYEFANTLQHRRFLSLMAVRIGVGYGVASRRYGMEETTPVAAGERRLSR